MTEDKPLVYEQRGEGIQRYFIKGTISWFVCLKHNLLATSHPAMPSSLHSFGAHSLRVFPQPTLVCTRTFTDSIGQRAMSAKNSALAEAAK